MYTSLKFLLGTWYTNSFLFFSEFFSCFTLTSSCFGVFCCQSSCVGPWLDTLPEILVRKALIRRRTGSNHPRRSHREHSCTSPMFEASETREDCAPLGVKTVFKPQNTLKQLLVRVEQLKNPEKKKEVVNPFFRECSNYLLLFVLTYASGCS